MLNSFFARTFRVVAIAGFVAVAAACGGSSPTAPATAVNATPDSQPATGTPSFTQIAATTSGTTAATFVPGGAKTNYTCGELATMYGAGAQWFEVKLDQTPTGSHQVGDVMLTANITNGAATSFNWSSNIGVDAVFVKSGKNGHNLYRYSPESTGGTGLTTPLVDGKYQAISHISFCYDVELLVAKTASTTFTRDYDWTITKAVDQPSVTVAHGGSATVNYTVAVAKDNGTDTDWAVTGTIAVTNPHPTLSATGVTVADNLSGFGAITVNCPSTALAPQASMTCTYSQALGTGATRTNTASADSTTFGFTNGEGTAAVSFVTPTTVLDNAVSVTDTFTGAGLSSTPIAASQTFTYARTFGASSFTSCGTATTFGNTASIATDDGVSRSASASVTGTLTCPPAPAPPTTPPTTPPPTLVCETAFAYSSTHSTTFSAIDPSISRWGWSNGPLNPGVYNFELWAGAGQNDLSKGALAGDLSVSYATNGSLNVTYATSGGWTLKETQLYVGAGKLPVDKNGRYTVAPGQYGNIHGNLGNASVDTFHLSASGPKYLVAHATVCR